MKKYFFLTLLIIVPLAVFAQTNTSNFVPLTNFPAFTSTSATGSSVDFASFFNSLYKYCIGLAAALALLQIMRAGFTWMTAGDSSEKVSQARSLITNAAFGLVLVLSPVIVFGIINPNILNLQLNFGGIAASSPSTTTTSTSNPTGASNNIPGTGVACTPTGGGTGISEPGKGCISTSNNGANTTSTALDCTSICVAQNAGYTTGTANGKGGCLCS
jgi:hypothetical protein